jgi:DNA-directed RNA polymerase subunit beta
MRDKTVLPKKYFSKYKEPLVPFPKLLNTQLDSFKLLLEKGIQNVITEFNPISDYSGKKLQLEFSDIAITMPKYDEYYAKQNKISFEAQIKARVKLTNKATGHAKEQEIFLSDIPVMTPHGTFVVNGVERVIVAQLARSPGVFFTQGEIRSKKYFGAKVIPSRGVWIEIEMDSDGSLNVKIDKKKKFPIVSLLRVLGVTEKEMIKEISETDYHKKAIEDMIAKDAAKTIEDAYVQIYGRLRDGDLATADNAREFINGLFSTERYDFSAVGRFRFNSRFGLPTTGKEVERRTLSGSDLLLIVSHILTLQNTPGSRPDDIDHLASRRVRYVGEMLEAKIRTGMMQMKRNIQDRMSTIDVSTAMPMNVLNQRPLQVKIKEFFTTNQLSQHMAQENVLDELEHLRILSALGPGGVTRERASIEVRDVHTSHYGRVCPIHTPEGPNIGLILHLSVYARVNDFGIIETPYVKVKNGKVTGEVVYMNALEEETYNIAHLANKFDDKGNLSEEYVEVRSKTNPGLVKRDEVDFIEVGTLQPFSIATSMIPFLEHNDANRALMGSNMQKQAVPCIVPEVPYVGTGIEEHLGRESGRLILAEEDGVVTHVDAAKIKVEGKKEDKMYELVNFRRTNDFGSLHQRPAVSVGQKVKKGDLLADTSTTVNGEAAIGQNIRVAFMTWNGHNYEDAIIVSERLIRKSTFTSIYIEEFVCLVRDTKLGPEITTRDIPNVGEAKLKDLDAEGVIRIGAEVRENDILVGKITPKGETELTPEERLLRSIFAEKARDVKDTSLRVDHGKRGRVIGVKVFSRELGHKLDAGIMKKIVIEVAQVRNVSVGDKLAGRHGNKGVISTVLPIEEMPFTEDGTPIDIILTPLGVPSRMNLGQIFEMHLGYAAEKLGYQAIVPPFSGATKQEIGDELEKAGLNRSGKVKLFDGRSGEPFEQDIAVGIMYMLKLDHMVEDKIHMRSIGPYSLITQQPLGGKAQGGGQRFGEMEVWALEGYGAAHTLQEMITIKSDDIRGRSQAFDSIIKNEPILMQNAPASFSVMLNYLRGLGLDVELGSNNKNNTVEEVEDENNEQ